MTTRPTVRRPLGDRLLRRLQRLVGPVRRWDPVLIVGARAFRTPVDDGLTNDGPDPALLQLYARLLPELAGDFVDVGVNIGQTLLAVRAVAPDMPYVGFEPNPVCVAHTQRLIRRNGITGATILPVALMDSPGLLALQHYADSAADSGASLIAGFRPAQPVRHLTHVPACTWAQVEARLPGLNPAFIKIDVEGAELEVLTTLAPVITRHRPWIGVEILPVYSRDNTDRLHRQQAIEARLRAADYAIYRVRRDPAGNLAQLVRLDTIEVHGRLDDCDYLLAPREAEPRLPALGFGIDAPARP